MAAVGGVLTLVSATSVAGVVRIRKLRQVQPPTQTVESLKEDVSWAKSQKS